jgi:hypothetical protein
MFREASYTSMKFSSGRLDNSVICPSLDCDTFAAALDGERLISAKLARGSPSGRCDVAGLLAHS